MSGTISLVVICSASFLYLSMKEHEAVYRVTVFNHLDALVNNMADDLVEALNDDEDAFGITTKLLGLELYDNIKYAVVYDAHWRILQKYTARDFMAESAALENLPGFDVNKISYGISIHQGDLVGLTIVGDTNYPLGYLLIVKSYSEPLKKSNRNLIANSLPVALVILISMAFLATIFSRRLLSPLSRLSLFTESIQDGHYHLRFTTKAKDEVASLGKHVNSMLERIESQNTELQGQVDRLEDQQKSLEKLANYDVLTHLPNRKFFMEVLRRELAKAKRNSTNLMVLFLDLDDFKSINDSLGHEAGDSLLVEVSEAILTQLRDGDLLARLGGDEFLILLGEEGVDSAVSVANRIITSLNSPIKIREWEIQTGVSIGISDAVSSNYDQEEVIRNADIAMYHAKSSGRNVFSLFHKEFQQESMRKMMIANALPKAIENSEFSICYQPKVSGNNVVNGFEALVRWNSSIEGFISPAEFIPIAEQSGKIRLITRWVIRQVFMDLSAIKSMAGDSVVTSINLSAHDIKDKNIISYIFSLLVEFNIDAKQIEFEVTESAYLDNFDKAKDFFNKLKDIGFRIALDDFGTGYSSMSYLTRISIDTLKIDRMFVNGIFNSSKDRLIIEAIIGLAHNLEINICAEGVEEEREKDFLLEHGCQQLQGYLYSKPVSIDDLGEIVAEITRNNKTVKLVQ